MDLQTILNVLADFNKPYPAREWAIIAALSLVLFAGGAVVAGQLFWSIQTGGIVAASTDVPRAPIPVSQDSIKKVIELYQTRAQNYQNKVFPGVTLADPRPTTAKR